MKRAFITISFPEKNYQDARDAVIGAIEDEVEGGRLSDYVIEEEGDMDKDWHVYKG